jgi:hypothetical protein
MKYASPRLVTKVDLPRLRQSVSEIVGKHIAKVRYRYPLGTVWPGDYPHGDIDEVRMAVVIDFDDHTSFIVSWAMQGLAGGLDVEVGPAETVAALPEMESEFDVSQSTRWQASIGESIQAAGVTWDISGPAIEDPPSYPETAWSIQLQLSNRPPVIIAVGMVGESGVNYNPQSLVVFFDEKDARKYRSSRGQASTDGDLIGGQASG